MNQKKIGKFIQEKRKSANLTQEELAEKLGVTDRAVSKWERGLNMPDASLMLDLTKILGVSVNELLSGEIIKKEDYMNKAEDKLLELQTKNQNYAKQLLTLEWVISILGLLIFLPLVFIAAYVEMETYLRIILIVVAVIIIMIACCFSIRIEQTAGFYKCSNCDYKYVPTYKSVFMAQHIGRSRRMKCPKCHTKCWHKKVIEE
ncbi:MAG: helix-turn-helix transcriptional regulator [Bacilli bacterium]|nr:helix-turn-helix transcriptional regulator [Bacilli bacterium]